MSPERAAPDGSRTPPGPPRSSTEPGRHPRRPAGTTSLIHRLASILDPLDLTPLFDRPRPVEVELGSGDGSFLAYYAAAHPESNFLGIERLLGRLRKTDRKGSRLGLTNLRLIRIEAAYLLEFLLPPASVEALHVYFPDPWPKRKHRRHRLVNERFPELAARSLRPGGRIYLRTDHADYFQQMNGVFEQHRGFHPLATPEELLGFPTDFEKGFADAGLQIHRAAYQLRAPGQTSITGPPPG